MVRQTVAVISYDNAVTFVCEYIAFWQNTNTPSLKNFLDFRHNMGDLEDPETEHRRYVLELNNIIAYYDETTEIGKKVQKWKEDFQVSCFTGERLYYCSNKLPCELLTRTGTL